MSTDVCPDTCTDARGEVGICMRIDAAHDGICLIHAYEERANAPMKRRA